MDVIELLPKVNCPDAGVARAKRRRVPFAEGRMVASSIPGAEFVTLESRDHILLEHQPAWSSSWPIARFVHGQAEDAARTAFTAYRAGARGSRTHRARSRQRRDRKPLSLRPKAVRNHINGIFDKLNVPNRAQAIVRAREAGMEGEPARHPDQVSRPSIRDKIGQVGMGFGVYDGLMTDRVVPGILRRLRTKRGRTRRVERFRKAARPPEIPVKQYSTWETTMNDTVTSLRVTGSARCRVTSGVRRARDYADLQEGFFLPLYESVQRRPELAASRSIPMLAAALVLPRKCLHGR